MASHKITVPGKATRIRGATWTHDQVVKLFDVWTEPEIYQGLLIEKKKIDIFKRMASTLTSQGVLRKWSEVRAKIKNLKADFRKALEKKSPFRYFEQMKKIMNLDGSSSSQPTSKQRQSPMSEPVSERGSESDEEEPGPSTPGDYETTPQSPDIDTHSHSSEADIISNKRFLVQTSIHQNVPTSKPDKGAGSQEIQYHYDVSGAEASAQDQEIQRIYQQKSPSSRSHEYATGEDSGAIPSSSGVITHVVSNIIEPVTSIVMPSQMSELNQKKSPYYSAEEYSQSPILPHSYPQSEPDMDFQSTQPPIRLEFVLDNEKNVVLHRSSSEPDRLQESAYVEPSASASQNLFREPDSPSPPPPSIISVDSRAAPPKTPAPAATSISGAPGSGASDKSLEKMSSLQKAYQRTTPGPSSSILRDQLKSPRRTPRTIKVVPHPLAKRKLFRGAPPPDQSKKRKLLELLNKKTVETISSLLTETSHSLLKELQDSEQRFIRWEEERRGEERKREEQMFTKLIAAMKASSQDNVTDDQADPFSRIPRKEQTGFVTNFKDVSKRLNDLVTDEMRATEESLRQWENKMQRQESRHTEKIFAMLINAVKRPDNRSEENDL